MRAAIYTRISRDDSGDGLGVERQAADCRSLCERRGWTIIETYVDNDFSAFSGRVRPAYQRLLADMGSGKIDAVVAWAPERLHRSPRELEDFIELLDRSGSVVETVKAGVWDVSTSSGRLTARMLGAVSRAESERTGERVSRAHQQAKERGFWRGPIPYGMKASTAPGRPEPDPDQTAVVSDIFRRVTCGDALTQIAGDLNKQEVPPRRGKAWTHTGIARLIASPALGGLVDVQGELRTALFDGVVSPDEWRAARAALRRRPKGEARRPRDKLTLLGGILTCQEHGSKCYGGSAGNTGIYVAGVPGRCFVSMSRRAADGAITHVVVERLGRPDAATLLRPSEDTQSVEREIEDLRNRRDELADLAADGTLSAAESRPRLARLRERLDAIEASRSPTTIPSEALVDPAAAWSAWTMTQRRELLRLLFAGIAIKHVGYRNGPRVDPGRLVLTWAR